MDGPSFQLSQGDAVAWLRMRPSESVDLLIHRWRGRTSAEILGRRGSIDVIIHA